MIRVICCALALAAVQAFAQDTPAAEPKGSVSGVVADARTGMPVRDADVYVDRNSKTELSAKTDSAGHFEIRGITPGNHRLTAFDPKALNPGFGAQKTRLITIASGESLQGIDIPLSLYGRISGRVLDENKEPIPGITVLLIAREYTAGALRHVYSGAARTNDLGEYTLGRVDPDRAYLLLAERRELRLPPLSDAPADPRFRRRVPAPVFYPGSPTLDGAAPLILRAGEHREGVIVRMTRTNAYCIDGTLKANGRPGPLSFQITAARPHSGASGNGAMFLSNPNGTAGEDGKFRICGLTPGDYTFTAMQRGQGFGPPAFFGNTPLSITDQDLHDLSVAVSPLVSLPGEIVFDGVPPAMPIEAKLAVGLNPINRSFMGENSNARADIPGTFTMEGLPADEYTMRINALPPTLYIKDITYNGHSVFYEPLRLGLVSAEAGMRIVLATDGGVINTTVTDANGMPVGDAWVTVIPANISSEAMLAAALVSGQTDQRGTWKSKPLEPAKYYVVATAAPVDKSPETISKLWFKRTHAQEIDLGANGTTSVTITPVTLD